MSLFDGIQLRSSNIPTPHLNGVVSWFGLETETTLRVRLNGFARGFLWVLVLQGDFVATLLLHALRQMADGDLAAHAEPVRKEGEEENILDRTKLNKLYVGC